MNKWSLHDEQRSIPLGGKVSAEDNSRYDSARRSKEDVPTICGSEERTQLATDWSSWCWQDDGSSSDARGIRSRLHSNQRLNERQHRHSENNDSELCVERIFCWWP